MEYRKQQFLTYDEFTRQFACDYAMPLARGGHGEIYRGVDLETNEEVAIKRRLYSVDDNALTLEKEYAHTQAVPVNRFVVRYLYYGRYVTPFGTYEFLVMRYYRDGNLTNNALSWSALSTLQQQRFVSEFLLGLSHLHTHGIVHRDIKPENVLLVRYSDPEGIAFRPVIVDFGISKMMTDYPEAAKAFVQNSMRIGTVTYMAPEQLRTENIDYNADLWSFGIILYELITGKHMIARKSFPETQREEAYAFWRMAGDERFPDDLRAIPQPYQQIIRKCLIVNTDERVQSARDLLDLLEFQPRIAEAEKAFRRQNWEMVIELLEPIVDRAEIPELEVWLQQARMYQALSKPMGVLVSEPPTSEFEDDFTRTLNPTPEEEIPIQDRTPEHTPDLPARTPEATPAVETESDGVTDDRRETGQTSLEKPVATIVPYTDKTELFDEPDQSAIVSQPVARPVAAEVASSPAELVQESVSPGVVRKADDQADVPTDRVSDQLQPEDKNNDSAAISSVPTQDVPATSAADVTSLVVNQPTQTDSDVPAANESETNVPVNTEVASSQRTEVFGEDDLIKSQANQSPLVSPSQKTELFDEEPPVFGKAQSPKQPELDNAPVTPPAVDKPARPEPLSVLKSGEALSAEPVTNVPALGDEGVRPLPSPGTLTNVPREQKAPNSPPAPPRPPQPSLLNRLLEKLNDVDLDGLKKQAGDVYQSAKQSKNRPLVVGGAVVLLLIFLFAVDTKQEEQEYIKLDPNESQVVALKRFRNYLYEYERTGELNQYVFAFTHCNPIYSDSLSRAVLKRAQKLQVQNELLFPGYKGSVWKLKLQGMKDVYQDKRNWEKHRTSLSDENCAPIPSN